MVDLNSLEGKELEAAMKGGTAGWGQESSAKDHARYSKPVDSRSRRRCHCGCKTRATLGGFANGVILVNGCEFSIATWVKTGLFPYRSAQKEES